MSKRISEQALERTTEHTQDNTPQRQPECVASAPGEPAQPSLPDHFSYSSMTEFQDSPRKWHYPELLSRVRVVAKRFADPDEAAAEMLAFAWANFASVARRRGVLLPPGLLVWASAIRLRSGRMMGGGSVRDVHSPVAQRRNRARVIYLSALSVSKRQQTLSDDAVERITDAVSSSERDGPAVRAAARVGWAALARRLPLRLRRILQWLAIGASKTWIARRLGISNGRVSQVLETVGREISAFFGADIVPFGCAA